MPTDEMITACGWICLYVCPKTLTLPITFDLKNSGFTAIVHTQRKTYTYFCPVQFVIG